jgi:hypothetical protein
MIPLVIIASKIESIYRTKDRKNLTTKLEMVSRLNNPNCLQDLVQRDGCYKMSRYNMEMNQSTEQIASL